MGIIEVGKEGCIIPHIGVGDCIIRQKCSVYHRRIGVISILTAASIATTYILSRYIQCRNDTKHTRTQFQCIPLQSFNAIKFPSASA
jgi:hypothetical protein